jgi:hypothetical protein
MLLGVFAIQAPDKAFPHAQEAARRALELDPELAEAQAHSAHVKGLSGTARNAGFGGPSTSILGWLSRTIEREFGYCTRAGSRRRSQPFAVHKRSNRWRLCSAQTSA